MEGHKLTLNTDMWGVHGWCECTDPDWTDRGWEGQIDFYGDTEEEVREYHMEHLQEIGDAEIW